jgi:hypothetical protein
MKTKALNLILLFVTIFLGQMIFSQDKSLSEIKGYKQFIENAQVSPSFQDKIKKYSSSDIKKISSMMYKTYDSNYIDFNRYRTKKNIVWMDQNNKSKFSEKKWSFIEVSVMNQIEKVLGRKSLILIRVPYYLKVNIMEIEKKQYKFSHRTINVIELTAQVLDIVKGGKYYKKDDLIKFYYGGGWRGGEEFKKGEIDFIGIEPREDEGQLHNALVVYNEERNWNRSYGRYPIINGILKDINNFWGYGKSLTWNDFKTNISNDINNIIIGR